MMKKLSKLIAVVAAMALLMAMSTSAFAAGINNESPVKGEAMDSNGLPVEGYVNGSPLNVADEISDADAKDIVENILNDTLKADDEVIIVDGSELEFVGMDGQPVTGGVTDVTFTIDVSKVPADANVIYVLHKFGSGANDWDVLVYGRDDIVDGTIEVTLQSLSPVFLAYLQQQANQGSNNNGNTGNTGNNNSGNAGNAANAANTGKSPKTGF